MVNFHSRAVRKAMIFDALWHAKVDDKRDYLTTHGIAKAIGVTPSTKLRKILYEMESEGTIIGRNAIRTNGWPVVHWSCAKPPKMTQFGYRSIPVKTAGNEVMRMELI